LDLDYERYTGSVIDEDAGIGSSKVALYQGAVFLLAGCVPELESVLVFVVFADFAQKIDAYRCLHKEKYTGQFSSNLFCANLPIIDDLPTPLSPRNTIFIFCFRDFSILVSFLSISKLIIAEVFKKSIGFKLVWLLNQIIETNRYYRPKPRISSKILIETKISQSYYK